MNAKFAFILLFCLYVYMCINVSPTPSSTYTRSEPLVTSLEIEITNILPLSLLFVCVVLYTLSHTDLNCRFISFDIRLNTLIVSPRRRHDLLDLILLVLSYLLIFDFFVAVFLLFELGIIDLDIRRITRKVVILANTFHGKIVNTTSHACIHLGSV